MFVKGAYEQCTSNLLLHVVHVVHVAVTNGLQVWSIKGHVQYNFVALFMVFFLNCLII